MKIFVWSLVIIGVAVSGFVLFESLSFSQDIDHLSEEVVTSEPEQEQVNPIRTLHFGDLMLDRGVEMTISRGVDPFEFIGDFIKEGNFDLVTANLEGPFAPPMECQDKPYSFRFEPEYVSFLQSAGITAVSLANNHTLDCYGAGLNESKKILGGASIEYFGGFYGESDDVLYKEIQGKTIALLGFDDTMKVQTLESMLEQVRSASDNSDIIIVNIHWGEEYFSEPVSRQREIASALAWGGADIVIGHHPHVIEPSAVVDSALVFYSLGNFVFDQLTLETQTGYAVETTLDTENEVVQVEIHPYRIVRNQPILLEGEEREEVCRSVLFSFSDRDGHCAITHSL